MPKTDKLDISALSPEIKALQDSLLARIVGQERAIQQIIKAYVPSTVNMHRHDRPLGTFLFLGPTGVGKSEVVKCFSKILLGNKNALTKIDCNEYQNHHESAKLIGAPPGYLGYSEEPRLSQKKIDQFQTKQSKINIVLFDEIEKADDHLFDAILSILGDGVLTLGNSNTTDFSRTFVFLTSNLGSRETRKLIEGSGIGFSSNDDDREELDDRIYRASKKAVEKKFRPEFINRLDKMVVFHSLSNDSLRQILRIELKDLQYRLLESPFRNFKIGETTGPVPDRRSILFSLTEAAKKFLLKEGTSEIYGARELNRTIDRFVGFPLATLISSEQLEDGDKVKIDYVDGDKDLTFTRDGRVG